LTTWLISWFSLTVTLVGSVMWFSLLGIISGVMGCSLLLWNTWLTLQSSGTSNRYMRGPVTCSILKGLNRRASNLGDGWSVAKSFESNHTRLPSLRGGMSACFLLYWTVCFFWACSSHILHFMCNMVRRFNLKGILRPHVGPSPVNIMSYPLFALKGDMLIDGW